MTLTKKTTSNDNSKIYILQRFKLIYKKTLLLSVFYLKFHDNVI